MKGPGLRIDLDVRRSWRCPKCGRTVRTPAHVVSQRCGCSEQGNWMRLELPVKRAPFVAPVREPLPEEDDRGARGVSASGGPETASGETASVAGAGGETASVAPAGGETASQVAASEEVGDVVAPVVEDTGPGTELTAAPPAPEAPSATGAPTPAADPGPAPDDFGAGLEGNSTERV